MAGEPWACKRCTFINGPADATCSMCQGAQSPPSPLPVSDQSASPVPDCEDNAQGFAYLCRVVRRQLLVDRYVYYQPVAEACVGLVKNPDTPEALAFARECLAGVIEIILNQTGPGSMTAIHLENCHTAVTNAAQYVARRFQAEDYSLCDALKHLVTKSKVFYQDKKATAQSPETHEQRQLYNAVMSVLVPAAIVPLVDALTSKWLGAGQFAACVGVILTAGKSNNELFPKSTMMAALEPIESFVLSVPESELKKEPSAKLADLCAAEHAVVPGAGAWFWFRMATRLFSCNALALRVVGMEQLAALAAVGQDSAATDGGLLTWLSEAKILQQVFGDNLHVQIIERFKKLFDYMLRHDVIAEAELQVIWAPMSHAHESVVAAIQQFLISASGCGNEGFLVALTVVLDSHLDEGFPQVVLVAQGLPAKIWQVQKPAVVEQFSGLLWRILTHPQAPAVPSFSMFAAPLRLPAARPTPSDEDSAAATAPTKLSLAWYRSMELYCVLLKSQSDKSAIVESIQRTCVWFTEACRQQEADRRAVVAARVQAAQTAAAKPATPSAASVASKRLRAAPRKPAVKSDSVTDVSAAGRSPTGDNGLTPTYTCPTLRILLCLLCQLSGSTRELLHSSTIRLPSGRTAHGLSGVLHLMQEQHELIALLLKELRMFVAHHNDLGSPLPTAAIRDRLKCVYMLLRHGPAVKLINDDVLHLWTTLCKSVVGRECFFEWLRWCTVGLLRNDTDLLQFGALIGAVSHAIATPDQYWVQFAAGCTVHMDYDDTMPYLHAMAAIMSVGPVLQTSIIKFVIESIIKKHANTTELGPAACGWVELVFVLLGGTAKALVVQHATFGTDATAVDEEQDDDQRDGSSQLCLTIIIGAAHELLGSLFQLAQGPAVDTASHAAQVLARFFFARDQVLPAVAAHSQRHELLLASFSHIVELDQLPDELPTDPQSPAAEQLQTLERWVQLLATYLKACDCLGKAKSHSNSASASTIDWALLFSAGVALPAATTAQQADVSAIHAPSVSMTFVPNLPTGSVPSTEAPVLTDEQYTRLLNLLGRIAARPAVAQCAWQLLMQLPTMPTMLQQFVRPSVVDWTVVLSRRRRSDRDTWRSLYQLQAMLAAYNSLDTSAARGQWCQDMVSKGGIAAVLAFVKCPGTPCRDTDTISSVGAMVCDAFGYRRLCAPVCACVMQIVQLCSNRLVLSAAGGRPEESQVDKLQRLLWMLLNIVCVAATEGDTAQAGIISSQGMLAVLESCRKFAMSTAAMSDAVTAVFRSGFVSQVLVWCLTCDHEGTRGATQQLLEWFIVNLPAAGTSRLLQRVLDHISIRFVHPQQLVACLLQSCRAASHPTGVARTWLDQICNRLQHWHNVVVSGTSDSAQLLGVSVSLVVPDVTRPLLVLLLEAICELLQIAAMSASDADLDAVTELSTRVVSLLLSACLFSVPSQSQPTAWSLCRTGDERLAGFQVLQQCLQANLGVQEFVLSEIERLCSDTSLPGLVESEWNISVAEQARAPEGMVGLRNLGATCYANSFLQQLFMSPQLQEGLMLAPEVQAVQFQLPRQTGAELDPELVAVVGEPIPAPEGGVTESKSDVPMGSTSVIDSSELPSVEPAAGPSAQSSTTTTTGGSPQPSASPSSITDAHINAALLLELQRLFLTLDQSFLKAGNPEPLVAACANLGLQFSVLHQNDAAEFCDKLIARLEKQLTGSNQAVLLDELFGGRMTTQYVRSCCNGTSELSESFVHLEVPIKRMSRLQDALTALVSGEVLTGDNAVYCERCGVKSPTCRRSGLSKLPKLLILQLKRFELDFSSMITAKVNDRCSFPTTLSMYDYTVAGMTAKEQADSEASSKEGDAGPSGMVRSTSVGNVTGMPSAAGGSGTAPPPASSTPVKRKKGASDGGGEVPHTTNSCQYRLVGVLVHSGTAGSGHYYSFILDRRHPDGGWWRFDDTRVTRFNPERLRDECFGGFVWRRVVTDASVRTFTQQRVPRSANAFMLFYERIEPRASVAPPVPTPLTKRVSSTTGSPSGAAATSPSQLQRSRSVGMQIDGHPMAPTLHETHEQIWLQNTQCVMMQHRFDPAFMTFLGQVLSDPAAGTAQEVPAITYLIASGLRTRESAGLQCLVKAVEDLVGRSRSAALYFLSGCVLPTVTTPTGEGAGRWLESHMCLSSSSYARNTVRRIAVAALETLEASGQAFPAMPALVDGLVTIIHDWATTTAAQHFGKLDSLMEFVTRACGVSSSFVHVTVQKSLAAGLAKLHAQCDRLPSASEAYGRAVMSAMLNAIVTLVRHGGDQLEPACMEAVSVLCAELLQSNRSDDQATSLAVACCTYRCTDAGVAHGPHASFRVTLLTQLAKFAAKPQWNTPYRRALTAVMCHDCPAQASIIQLALSPVNGLLVPPKPAGGLPPYADMVDDTVHRSLSMYILELAHLPVIRAHLGSHLDAWRWLLPRNGVRVPPDRQLPRVEQLSSLGYSTRAWMQWLAERLAAETDRDPAAPDVAADVEVRGIAHLRHHLTVTHTGPVSGNYSLAPDSQQYIHETSPQFRIRKFGDGQWAFFCLQGEHAEQRLYISSVNDTGSMPPTQGWRSTSLQYDPPPSVDIVLESSSVEGRHGDTPAVHVSPLPGPPDSDDSDQPLVDIEVHDPPMVHRPVPQRPTDSWNIPVASSQVTAPSSTPSALSPAQVTAVEAIVNMGFDHAAAMQAVARYGTDVSLVLEQMFAADV